METAPLVAEAVLASREFTEVLADNIQPAEQEHRRLGAGYLCCFWCYIVEKGEFQTASRGVIDANIKLSRRSLVCTKGSFGSWRLTNTFGLRMEREWMAMTSESTVTYPFAVVAFPRTCIPYAEPSPTDARPNPAERDA
jgi:hypothetical protein